MQFLSDVYLRCPDCDGRRYRDEVLDSPPRGRERPQRLNIAEVLNMTVTEALRLLRRRPARSRQRLARWRTWGSST